jgi:flagellar biogenesis protein FliO
MLALAGPVCVAGTTQAPAQDAPSAAQPRTTDGYAPSPALIGRLRAEAASTQSRVEQANFESPLPSSESGGSEDLDSPSRPPASPTESDASKPLPLGAPGALPPIPLEFGSGSEKAGTGGQAAGPGGLSSIVAVGSSLTLVLSLFLIVAWLMRRAAPGGSAVLPGEVVELLGRAALAGRAQIHLVRVGNKLLLLSISTAGVEPLTEITDPDEVNRLAGLCRQAQPGSTTAAFRQVLQQLAGTRTGAGPRGRDDDLRRGKAAMIDRSDVTWEGRDV